MTKHTQYYSSEDIQFLKDNYCKIGSKKCAELLGRKRKAITQKAAALKITRNKKELSDFFSDFNTKTAGEFTVNERFFIEDINEIGSYLLGFLWADGYLRVKVQPSGKTYYTIVWNIVEPDAIKIDSLINQSGVWSRNLSKPKKGKINVRFTCCNTLLGKYLYDNDYHLKSSVPPTKILKSIPSNLHPYFYHGFFDGDGCFFAKRRDKSISQTLSSTYDQDWEFLETICNRLNCKYTISRKTNKNGWKVSIFTIKGSVNCLRFGDYIFNHEVKNIGLSRKQDKMLLVIDYINYLILNKSNKWKNIPPDIKTILNKYNNTPIE